MADDSEDIQSRLSQNLHGWDQISAALAYIPLVGWAYAKYARKGDELCQYHGKQSLQLNALYAGVYLAIWFLSHFPLTSWLFGERAFLHPLAETLNLVSTFIFLSLSAVAALKAFSEEKWEIPYLQDAVDFVTDILRFPQ